MPIIEKYIREKLGRADAPPEVDANDLWAGIESQLAPENKLPPKARTFLWQGVGLGLLLILVGGLAWLLYPTSSPETVLAEVASTSATTAEYKTSTNQSATATPTPTKSETTQVTDTKVSQSASTSPDATTLSTATKNEHFPNGGTNENTPDVNTSHSTVDDQPQGPGSSTPGQASPTRATLPKPNAPTEDNATDVPTGHAASDTKTESLPSPELVTSSALQKQEQSTTEERAKEPAKDNAGEDAKDESNLPPNQTASSVPQTEEAPVAEESPEALTKEEDEDSTFKSSRGARLSLGLHAGTNLLIRQYATSGEGLGQSLNTAVSPAAGVSFGLDLNYRITERLSVTTGLEYHRTLNPFDHNTTTDTMIAHPSPINSGLIEAVAKRRTTHNHRLNFLTVPLLVNHTWTFGNFDLGVGAGLGLNFRQSATGKTFSSDGLVIAYDAASGAADVPSFFLSYRLQPVLSWQPKPDSKLRFALTGNLSYQTFGVSELSGVKQDGLLIGGSVGLRYGF